ncbi:MAG: tripartite tricarboxylate transporter substrate binding protein [Proteobacteria bacterium]|nr:tripartite tricarboxylate transporter substrate binding protein [Pseudomonadota bacterium]
MTAFLPAKLAPALLACSLLGTAAAPAQAQPQTTVPCADKAIRFIVSTSAGGGADLVARALAKKLSDHTKQTIVIENKPGASGILAGTTVLGAPANGCTFLFGITTMAQWPAVATNPAPYDAEKDFIPVSLVARSSNLLIASRQSGVNTLQDLVKLLKSQDRRATYGSWGNGSTAHFMGELFARETGTHPVHVPYKGGAPMMSDLLGGVITFAFADVGSAQAHLKSDRLHVLGATGTSRLPSLPQLPTLAEQGIKGLDFGGWFGLFAAKGTPMPAVDALAGQVAAAVRSPELRSQLVEMNLDPVGSTSAEFKRFFAEDSARWQQIAKAHAIKAE